jgi:hypothetical protein
MKKSKVQLVNALKEKLLEFPGIVKKLERKDVDFVNQLILWISKSEEILSTYNISNVSELSGLKSKIIATKYSNSKDLSIKKLQLKVAAESLFDIQHIVLKVLTPFEVKVEECRELIRQLLLIVSQAKVIKYNKQIPFDNLINDIWQFIISNEQLKPGAVKLRTSITLTDIQLLIAEEVNLEDF